MCGWVDEVLKRLHMYSKASIEGQRDHLLYSEHLSGPFTTYVALNTVITSLLDSQFYIDVHSQYKECNNNNNNNNNNNTTLPY